MSKVYIVIEHTGKNESAYNVVGVYTTQELAQERVDYLYDFKLGTRRILVCDLETVVKPLFSTTRALLDVDERERIHYSYYIDIHSKTEDYDFIDITYHVPAQLNHDIFKDDKCKKQIEQILVEANDKILALFDSYGYMKKWPLRQLEQQKAKEEAAKWFRYMEAIKKEKEIR